MNGQGKGVFGWISLAISIYFIIKGVMYLNEGEQTFGLIMLVVGTLGFGFKAYQMTRRP